MLLVLNVLLILVHSSNGLIVGGAPRSALTLGKSQALFAMNMKAFCKKKLIFGVVVWQAGMM